MGIRGETIARKYLEQKGFKIVGANVFTHWGEIDVIARDPLSHELVFVEVKTRSSHAFGFPEESLDARKKQRLARSIQRYFLTHQCDQESYRIDLVAIDFDHRAYAHVRHYKNISLDA